MTLKSLTVHNEERRRARELQARQAMQTGVACPLCGTELLWKSHSTGILSAPEPETAPAECPKCKNLCQVEK